MHTNRFLEKIALNAQKARALADKVGVIPDGNWKWALRNLRGPRGEGLEGHALDAARTRLGATSSAEFGKLKDFQKLHPDKEVGYTRTRTGGVQELHAGTHGTVPHQVPAEAGATFGHTHPHHENFGGSFAEKPHHVTNPSGIHEHKDMWGSDKITKKSVSDASYSQQLREKIQQNYSDGKISADHAGEIWDQYSPKTLSTGRQGRDINAMISRPNHYNRGIRTSNFNISNTSLGVEGVHRTTGIRFNSSGENHLLKMRSVYLKHK